MSNAKVIPTYGKLDINSCMNSFRLLILNNLNDIQKLKANLINSGKMSHTEKEYIRAFSWKIFLNTISIKENSSLRTWIEQTISKRKSIKNSIKKNTLNKFKGDPLGGLVGYGDKDSEGWNSFFNQSEIIKIINFDVERTMPNEKLFQEPYIQEMENTILKIFSKNHKDVSYRQGMNEILSVLIYAMYPYYFKSPITKYTNEIIEKWVKEPLEYYKELYYFFHDENELENDVYYLMENLMIKYGLAKFFDDPPLTSNLTPYLIKRTENIIIKKLGQQDRQLYFHFINENLDYVCVFQRWLKCIFKREFPIKKCCLIWDCILANEGEENTGQLIYIDYILIAMILNIKNELLKRDSNEMFELLLHYPKVDSFNNLLINAQSIKENLSTTNHKQNFEEKQFSTSSKEQPIIKRKEEIKIEEGSQSTKNIIQINPLLFNPNLMLNPQIQNNLKNNHNMMFYPYNAMMAQQIHQSIRKPKPAPKIDFEIISKEDLSPMEKIKSSYYVSDSLSISALKELKNIGNKYKYLFTIEDINRLNFLIDTLSKKL